MEDVTWKEIFEKYRLAIFLGIGGVILLIVGVLTGGILPSRGPEIEILPASETRANNILVDIGGSVERSGIYELPSDSRLNDLLIRAGGLSAEADRDWVEKNLNLAQKLVDGTKIYIPRKGEALTDKSPGLGSSQIAGVTTKVNINSASAMELDSLWGIGTKRAADIIKNRPYSSVEDLLNKKIIPRNVYERIKDEIGVF